MRTYPVMQSQLGVILDNQNMPESSKYDIPLVIELGNNDIDMNRLENALLEIVRKRPVMRTRFIIDDNGNIRQWSDPDMVIPVLHKNYSEEDLHYYLDHDFIRPFHLFSNEPLVRFELVQTEKQRYLLINFHHSIMDGMAVISFNHKDLGEAYAGCLSDAPEYGIFEAAEEEQHSFDTEDYRRAADFYKKELNGISFLSIPGTVPGNDLGKRHNFTAGVDSELCDRWCSRYKTKPYYLFSAAFSLVLSRLSREKKIAFLSLYHGRADARLKDSYGMFVKDLPYIVEIDDNIKVLDFIQSMRVKLHQCIENSAFPFTHLCRDMQMTPGISLNYLVNGSDPDNYAICNHMKHPCHFLRNQDYSGAVHTDILLSNQQYQVMAEGSSTAHKMEDLQMIAEAVRDTVVNMISMPERRVREIPIVSAEKTANLIRLGTGDKLEYDEKATAVDLFRKQVQLNPHAVAVVDQSGGLTYDELEKRSNILAATLIKHGVRANDFVAVKLPRVKEFLLSVLGIWKTGCAYVPVDPDYPPERISYMLEDAGAAIVIDPDFLAKTDFSGDADPVNCATPDKLAYMIYTSGSTGKPKGTMISHASLTAFLSWLPAELGLTPGSAVAEHASFSFDASICDLYPSIASGSTLHILSEEIRKDLIKITDYFNANHITGATFSTQLGMELLNCCNVNLKYIIMGGEKLKHVKKTSTRIYNGYGPTEFTCWSSHHIVDQERDGDDIPIGRPVPNSVSAIVDPVGNLVPYGATGELILIGPQIARGYWKRSELTAERFADCPFLPGQKMYHTGDLAHWNPNGELMYQGRIDNQVKLRGFRIEMGEIEAALVKFPGISSAAAEIRTINGIQHLVAYYISENEIDESVLKDETAKSLTDYMVPDIFMRIENMPLTPNGKVNRKALPVPELKAEKIVAPETDFEKKILDVAIAELGTDQIGVTTNLITMGLTSIRAIRLSAAIKKLTGYEIPAGDILTDPHIRNWQNRPCKNEAIIEKQPQRESYPLTSNQLGIYLDWEKNPSGLQYNVPLALRFDNLDANKLRDALKKVVDAHPYFKVHIEKRDNEILQIRRDSADLPILLERLYFNPGKKFFQSRVKPFDLLNDDLSRFEIYETNGNVYLFIDVHHILYDGASVNILLSSLAKAYNNVSPEPEIVDAFDFSLFFQKWLQSEKYTAAEEYFKALLADTESFMCQPENSNSRGNGKVAYCNARIPLNPVRGFCREQGVTENACFATAICQVFHRIGRTKSVQIATVSGGRSLVQLSNTVGMFVKTLPLVSKTREGSISHALREMQDQIIKTIENESFPFTELSEKYQVKPNVLYVYQGDVIDKADDLFHWESIPLTLSMVKMPVAISITPDDTEYDLLVEYDAGLYAPEEMERLLNSIATFVKSMVLAKNNAKLDSLELVSAEERERLIALGTGDKMEYDHTKTIVDFFLERVKENPLAAAAVDSAGSMTYGELDRQSNIIAEKLIRNKIAKNSFVAIKLPRIKEFIAAVIGVWKAGCAYVPVDPDYPPERISYMLEDAGAAIVIDPDFLAKTDFSGDADPVNYASPDKLAYMIYTSGSTGKPKGTMISHTGLAAIMSWLPAEFGLAPGDSVAEYVSFSFDASICDLYSSIASGATVHILSESLRKDLIKIADYFNANHIIGAAFSTQLGMELLNCCNVNLKYIALGGEKLKHVKKTSTRIYNGYGPTEFTCWSSHHIVDQERDGDDIPIGRPVPNSVSAIVDPCGRLVPSGMTGELVLIGPQIARGYWNRPELTAERFADCPFLPGQKMYHTGDLARWNKDGELMYQGRIDNQVKLRGFRVEMGEIEAALVKFPGINSGVVEVKNVCGIQHLTAYYVSGKEIDEAALKAELAKTLADYMVPDIYMRLDKMPLTPNGKTNRKALPVPSAELMSGQFVEPENDTEKIICSIYGEVLNLERYGALTDFFAAGGTSLLGIRIVAALQKMKFNVVYGDIFKYKNPRDLARFLNHDSPSADGVKKTFDYGAYDYSAIDAMLKKTRSDLFDNFDTHPHGDVLLTGVTGYLGIHVLKYLLENTGSMIGLLIREKHNMSPEMRLSTQYVYYFDDLFPEEYKERLIFIEGDITDKDLHEKLSGFHYDTLFNCAAMVKHYVADNTMDLVNVDGVRNLIDCCTQDHARLIQVSTCSIGGVIAKDSPTVLDEYHLYVGQDSDNDYIRTKFLAERYLLEEIAAGHLKGKIMRLGNLAGRESDGEFQINVRANASVNALKSYASLKAYPLMQLVYPMEMSPIDRVAEAVVKLASTPDDMIVFHPFNTYHMDMGAMLDAINQMGHRIDYVSTQDFAARIEKLRNDPDQVKNLQGILHYGGHFLANCKYTRAVNQWTTTVLYRLGFSWKQPDERYLAKFLLVLDQMRVFLS